MKWFVQCLGAALLCGCGDREVGAGPEKRGAPPPPVATSSGPVSCTRAAIDDPVTKDFFPAKHEGFCLDPQDGGKALGEGTKLPLEGIADLFDGESKIYEDHGVKRVVQLRYIDAAGGPASIDIVISRFDSDAGAYAMFTKRVVGDGDPADPATPKPLSVSGRAALGVGSATLWRGSWLTELVYNDDSKSPKEIETLGAKVLEPLAKAVLDKLPGEVAPPPEVAALPEKDRLPQGTRLLLKGGLPGVPTSPRAGVGYYRAGSARYRVSVLLLADEQAAKDVMKDAEKALAASPVPGLGDDAWKGTLKEGSTQGEVLVARRGARVLAISDELRVYGGEAGKGKLELDKKRAILSELVK